MSDTKFRVGILINSFTMPRWRLDLLRDLQDSGDAEIALVVKQSGTHEPRPISNLERLRYARSQFVRVVLDIVDQRFSRVEYNAFELVSIAEVLDSVNVLEVEPLKKRFSDYFPDDAVNTIKSYNLDLMLRFGFRILRGNVLRSTRYGVWSYHHGDNRVNRGVAPGFWEVAEQHPVTGTVLQVLDESLDGGRLLYRSCSRTDRYSPFQNKNRIFARSHTHVSRVLRRMKIDGVLPDSSQTGRVVVYDRRLYKDPSTGQLLCSFANCLARYCHAGVRSIFTRKRITIYYKTGLKAHSELVFYRFKKLDIADSRMINEPCLIEDRGKPYLFGQTKTLGARVSSHVVLLIEKGQRFGELQELIGLNFSCGSIFTFRYGERFWLIASNVSAKRIELYRCESFPKQWAFHSTLINEVVAYRPNLFVEGERLHLFFNLLPLAGNVADELYHFTAGALDDEWHANPRNPVVDDARCAVSAGGCFRVDNRLFRPTLDCSMVPNSSVGLRLLELDSFNRISETLVEEIEPKWVPDAKAIIGFHRSESCCVVEVQSG